MLAPLRRSSTVLLEAPDYLSQPGEDEQSKIAGRSGSSVMISEHVRQDESVSKEW